MTTSFTLRRSPKAEAGPLNTPTRLTHKTPRWWLLLIGLAGAGILASGCGTTGGMSVNVGTNQTWTVTGTVTIPPKDGTRGLPKTVTTNLVVQGPAEIIIKRK
jgi:hypothetical protein